MTIEVIQKTVQPVTVLSVLRRVKGQAEILQEIDVLRPLVADVVCGPTLALRLGYPYEGKLDVEIAFPTAGLVERDGFVAKTLPSVPMLSFTHVGPVVDGPAGTNLSDTRKEFVQFVREKGVFVGDDPERFIYHEGAETHGDRAERYVTEDQYPYHMPIWLGALADGTSRVAGAEAARRVMTGSETFVESYDTPGAAAWLPGAMDRLDAAVPSESDRADILNACAHHYIVQSANVMRSLAERAAGDVRKLIDLIAAEPRLGATYWLDEAGDDLRVLVRRRPADPEGYDKATDPAEKRYHACFCPLVRDAIRRGDPVSRTFCHCSGGWYVQEWSVVFGEPPRVDLVETMLDGADACVFAIHVPHRWR